MEPNDHLEIADDQGAGGSGAGAGQSSDQVMGIIADVQEQLRQLGTMQRQHEEHLAELTARAQTLEQR